MDLCFRRGRGAGGGCRLVAVRVHSALISVVLLLGLLVVGTAAAATPSQQQYGNPASGASPAQQAPKQTTLHQAQHSSALPFTGARLEFPLLAGVVLIGLGLAVRRSRRRES